jgi:alpha-galactosidase
MKENLLGRIKVSAQKSRPAAGGGFILTGPSVTLELPFRPGRYLRHGWQSWSLCAWVDTAARLPPMRPAILHSMQTDPVYARIKNHNGSWYGAVEAPGDGILLLGSLGLEAHVELRGRSLQGCYEDGTGDWFVGMGEEAEVFTRYRGLLEARFGRGRFEKAPTVWCSWYSFYHEISEPRLEKILSDLGDLPFDVFQVDDGWQRGIGDWEANGQFPSGMDRLADKVKATGRTPGLWLAPLVVVPSSAVCRDHPDWLLRDKKGRPVSAGLNWGEPLRALDTTHPEVLAWLTVLMEKVRRWGYAYVKLDFLYAGALPGKRHVDMPREAAYRQGLQAMRRALGDAYLLTCAAPVFPSLGVCDGLRVGPDVSGDWDSYLISQLLVNFTIPGARAALRTTFHRLWLQELVNTDPDVVYFSSKLNRLTAEQKNLLRDLACIAGFKASSDLPATLTEAERSALREFLLTSPPVERLGRTSFRLDRRVVDFGDHLPVPGRNIFTRMLGVIVGWFANFPALERAADRLGFEAYKKALAKVLE